MKKAMGDAASVSTVHTLQNIEQSSLALALSSDNQITFDNMKRLDIGSHMFTVFTVQQGEEGRVRSCGDPLIVLHTSIQPDCKPLES